MSVTRRPLPFGPLATLAALPLLAGCAEAPAPPGGPPLTVKVAALHLAGVGDVVWDLEVRNGATTPDVVWQRRVASSRYGDGAGSASYVGTCDADANPNVVRVWVVGVYEAAVDDPGRFASGADDGVGTVDGTALAFQNPTALAPLERTVECTADSDVAVAFDVTLMRPAQQGFFDVAVNFNDVFCSAKFDCCDDADDSGTCEASEALTLLFDATPARARTMVLGFACTAGTDDADVTTLYLDPLSFDCTSPADGFAADFTVSPAGPETGNQCTAGQVGSCLAITDPLPAEAASYLYQVAVYRGDERLTSGGAAAHKVYWNVALGVTDLIGDCQLRTRGTADNASDAFDGMVGGVVANGAVYPYVSWDVPLGSCAEEALSFGADGAVRTRYTETTAAAATPFGYSFAPGLPPAPICAAACVNGGTCTAPNTCTCPSGFGGPTCATLTTFTSCLALQTADPSATSGIYTLDPDGAGSNAPFSAYCDMTTDGGGWTLVMRFAPTASIFHFKSPYWTNTATLDEGSLDPTTFGDAKYASYHTVLGSEIRGCLRHPTTGVYGCKVYGLPSGRTAYTLFTGTTVGSDSNGTGGLYFIETDAERLLWLTYQGRTLSQASVPSPGYVRTGVNIDDDMSCYDARVRFGLVLNNETSVNTLNDAAGFGASAYYSVACDYEGVDAPWSIGAGFAAGGNLYQTAGQIWMR